MKGLLVFSGKHVSSGPCVPLKPGSLGLLVPSRRLSLVYGSGLKMIFLSFFLSFVRSFVRTRIQTHNLTLTGQAWCH